ncbi:MAG: BNR repeat-containing protein [Prolixibacteraceae bacterium]
MKSFRYLIVLLLTILLFSCESSKEELTVTVSNVGLGWAKTSVNATIFRKNSIVSLNGYQFVAYYDTSATVVLAKRKTNEDQWQVHRTKYKGNVNDAHNIISIMVDGDGYLHMSWDHHNNALNYCQSLEPFGIEMGGKEKMIGSNEQVVSYPEFYRFSNGDLLFAYRDGGSGNGNLVLNRYHLNSKSWERIQSNLIDGEKKRNAYWQLFINSKDEILLSWVWRESPDVASNHDLCFAKSVDGGLHWVDSKAKVYQLPIRQNTAEVIFPIPQNSNLINQTSMCSDERGNAYIATYFKLKDDSSTQFHLIYQHGLNWKHSTISDRADDFNLSGMGTRRIPISRPQVLLGTVGEEQKVIVIYRDADWADAACISTANLLDMKWETRFLSPQPLGAWEPSFDTELWKTDKKLNLFIQKVGQGQGETTVEMEPQMVSILELDFED